MKYLCLLNLETNGYSATVADFANNIIASADTKEKIIQLTREALAIYLQEMNETPTPKHLKLEDVSQEILEDFDQPEAILLEPMPMNPVSLEVERIIERSDLTLAVLAKRMGTSPAALVRMKNPFYWGQSLETLRKLAEATNTKLEVHFKMQRKPTAVSTTV
jgi:antitoxin HicB